METLTKAKCIVLVITAQSQKSDPTKLMPAMRDDFFVNWSKQAVEALILVSVTPHLK